MKTLLALLALGSSVSAADVHRAATREPIRFGSFDDAKLDGWTATGDAFRWMRAGAREIARGVEGAGFVSSQRSGPNTRGTLTSPPITAERRYLNFQIAGTRDSPLVLGAQLLQGETLANAASGTDEKDPAQRLAWRTWDLAALAGKQVTIRLQDDSATGALAFDSFEQSDTPRAIPTQGAGPMREQTFRPQFHYTPLAGWMNDVNGLFYYAGQWHAFHQYRVPGQPQVSWGHATSDDLLHWQHLPVAIPAEGENSAFSGSAAIDWYNTSGLQTTEHPPILLCYTLHPPGNSGRKADQRLAFSRDGGQSFAPYAGNPVIQTPDFNDRDPRLFFHAPTRSWDMVLSLTRNNTQRDLATYGIFRSWDLNAWELIQRVGPGPWYWECPDMFEIAIAGDPEHKTKWLLGKGSGDYLVGEFDGQKFTPETEPIRTQFGGSFYGAQTFSDAPEGRRVQIGWMNSGPKETTPFAYPAMAFNQQMSFPRELTLRRTPDGLRLYREPVREIAQLYARTIQLSPRVLSEGGGDPFAELARMPLLDLDLTIGLESTRRIWLTLGGETVMFDSATSRLTAFDRTIPWPIADGRLRLRALLDRTSLELFGNNGELTHSGVFFHDPATAENHLVIEGPPAHLERLVAHELQSIWR
jgi:sucrose-6-phosphate hydrolase SacC (GH32 family)